MEFELEEPLFGEDWAGVELTYQPGDESIPQRLDTRLRFNRTEQRGEWIPEEVARREDADLRASLVELA